jgi:riboflavin kinase/FMN adenylyltransferase
VTWRARRLPSAGTTASTGWWSAATSAAATWATRPANLQPLAHSAVPADGVYAGRLIRGPARPGQAASSAVALPAAISIGTNPTFAGRERRVEAYVLDAEPGLDLYGEQVGLSFAARLRETVRFDGIEPLLVQMAADVQRTREVLGAHPAG